MGEVEVALQQYSFLGNEMKMDVRTHFFSVRMSPHNCSLESVSDVIAMEMEMDGTWAITSAQAGPYETDLTYLIREW